ncbi:putative ROK family protein [Vibrio crassostreae]|nr:putative ROK family protein [Vibrio crassostreae]CAK2774448.1 putative ROK family protein [Vibrio crassostreae]CAK3217367.1 putative ROK family protein [Vibrio crassostreae]CAK3841882.1 putative ROK family protein [Vibrio crassostreae]
MDIAIDIGGSKIALAIAVKRAPHKYHKISLNTHNPQNTLLELYDFIEENQKFYGEVRNIVLAAAPNIDPSGVVSRWPNCPQWEGVNFVESLSQLVSGEIVWCDDGVASTIADIQHFNSKSFMHIVIGTGLGGSFYINGKVFAQPELGHQIVKPEGKTCVCKQKGCLQAYVSAGTLVQVINNGGTDAVSQWLESAAKKLAIFVYNLTNMLKLDLSLVSGGLIKQVPELIERTNVYLSEMVQQSKGCAPLLMLSPNIDNAPLAGALYLLEELQTVGTKSELLSQCQIWRW